MTDMAIGEFPMIEVGWQPGNRIVTIATGRAIMLLRIFLLVAVHTVIIASMIHLVIAPIKGVMAIMADRVIMVDR